MNYKFLLTLILGIFLIGFISASTTTLITSPNSFNVNPGDSGNVVISYSTIAGAGDSAANGVVLTGSPKFISYSGGSISYSENTTTNGTFSVSYSIPSNQEQGTVVNSIVVDGLALDLTFNIQSLTGCKLNPSLVSYAQTVQFGTEFEIPKITFNPKNCQGELSISTAYISGGVTTPEGQKPVFIKSVSQKEIILGVDTKGLGSATYDTKLTVTAFGETFTDISTIKIITTGGTSTIGNFTAETLPTCSITGNDLTLNQTYSMVCTNLQPDVTIMPKIDNDYIKGVGVDISSNQYVWNFRARQIGATTINAEFFFRGAPVGDLFSQNVKITPGGAITGSINLDFIFYQEGKSVKIDELSAGETIVQVVDNSTRSLVSSYNLLLNGINTNNTIKLESDKEYELRATSPGYLDLVKTLEVSRLPIIITINPQKDFYYVGEQIEIQTNPNATLTLDEVSITNQHTLYSAGNKTIKALAQGYLSSEKNITILSQIYIVAQNKELNDWKKGDDISLQLSDNSSWTVYYKETDTSEPVAIATGSGKVVNFKISDLGTYQINSGDLLIHQQKIEKKGIMNWFSNNWYWVLLGIALIIGGYFLFKDRGDDEGWQFTGVGK